MHIIRSVNSSQPNPSISLSMLKLPRIMLALMAAALVFLAEPLRSETSEQPLSPAVTEAFDALLTCERPQGGWMYVCERGTRIAGFTNIMKKAERIAGALGLARWDLLVLRSPGTPAAGLLLVRAYQRTGQEEYLAAARRTGDLLVNLQLPSGGWFSEMPVYGDRLARWFRLIVPWTTLDDEVTSGAIRFLLALWEVTGDARYREAAVRGLDLLLDAQLPSGAWPLTWRPAWLRLLSPSFEDWPSLNDAATTGPIHASLAGARVLGRPELLEAAQRGGDWLLQVRSAAPSAGWAQQYDLAGHPAPGRRFEPVALASWESRHVLEALQALAEVTGERRFCAPFPETIDWLVRSALAPGCWARFYSVDLNTPIYVGQDGSKVPSAEQAKRPYRWKGDFGIPALLTSLGLDETGRPFDAGVVAPPDRVWHLPGDAGDCSGIPSGRRSGIRPPSPRVRISEAASRLARLEPAGAAVCAPLLSRPTHEAATAVGARP